MNKATKKNDSLKDRIREELVKAGPKGVKVRALIKKFGKRTPARIFDLRDDGLNVVTEPSRGPSCVYKIIGKVKSKPKKTQANHRKKKGAKKR